MQVCLVRRSSGVKQNVWCVLKAVGELECPQGTCLLAKWKYTRHLRRKIIPALLQTLRIAGPSVEVGVWKGDYSSVILNGWRGTQSHTLVDPYKQPGGIIAGHDFTHLPLARAVVKFLRIHARTAKIYVTPDHPASWIVAKC